MKRTIATLAGLTLASGIALAGDDAKKQTFEEVDHNKDGRVSQTEVLETLNDMDASEYFAQADIDRDGFLNQQEFVELQTIRAEQEEAE